MDKKTVLYNYCQCLSPPSHPFGLNSLIAFLTPICQMSFQFVQVGSAALRMCCFLENFLPLSPHFFGVFICFLKGTTLVSCKICLYFSEIKVNLPKSENNNSIWLNSCDLQGKKKWHKCEESNDLWKPAGGLGPWSRSTIADNYTNTVPMQLSQQ